MKLSRLWNILGWITVILSIITGIVRTWDNPLIYIGLLFGFYAWNNSDLLIIKERLCIE